MKWYSLTPTDYTVVARINQLARTDDVSYSPVLKSFSWNAISTQLFTIAYRTYGGWQFDDLGYNDLPVAFADLKANINLYDLDQSVLTVKAVHILNPNNGTYEQVPSVTDETVNKLISPTSQDAGSIWAYKIVGNTLAFVGVPSVDVALGIRLTFDRVITYITTPTDPATKLGLHSMWHELACKGVACEYNGIRVKTNEKLEQDWADGLSAYEDYYRSRWQDRQPTGINVRDTVRENI